MFDDDDQEQRSGPKLSTLLGKTARTGLGLLHNRGELLLVELQEEKSRAVSVVMWSLGAMMLANFTLLLLSGMIIFLVQEPYRVYAAAGLTALYLVGTIVAVLRIKSLLKEAMFAETVAQFRKDREWLENFE